MRRWGSGGWEGVGGGEATADSLFTDFMACQGGPRVGLGTPPKHGLCASGDDFFLKQGDVMCGRNEYQKGVNW